MLAQGAPQSRARSLDGCVTCRVRKVKCDEIRPACHNCQIAGIECGGFRHKLRWMPYQYGNNSRIARVVEPVDGEIDENDSERRRPLHTEAEKREMSEDLLLKVTQYNRSLSRLLNELDTEATYRPSQEQFERGPFGVFRASQHLDLNLNLSEDPTQDGGIEGLNECLDICLPFEETSPSLEEIISNEIYSSHQISSSAIIPMDSQIPITLTQPEDITPMSLPMNTQYLLNFWRDGMDHWFSPLHTSKHPWSILHLPVALSAISDLSVWGTSSHARIAVLRALLAASAFLIDRNERNTSTYWRHVATSNEDIAKNHLKRCFSTQLHGPEKAKYKEILLALLSLVSACAASGRHKEARSYLLDAEKLIALRGIPKVVKSRKVRILHHIFLFLRVIEESTFIYPRGSSFQSSPEMESLQFPSLQTYTRINGQKFHPDFEQEFILQSPGDCSLMLTIYGIPISLFSLISRATSLANNLEFDDGSLLGETRSKLIRELEDETCAWNPYDAYAAEAAVGPAPIANGTMLPHIVSAIHNSLFLYFYRRIHNINPMMLQPYVDKVLENLEMMEHNRMQLNVLNTSIIWPGFMAAVEACGETRRQKALRWIRRWADESGWGSFKNAARFVEELWERQEVDPKITWVDLLRGNGTVLILT